jgi:hypothetical protein
MPIVDALRCTGARDVVVLAKEASKLTSALSTMLGEVLDGHVGSVTGTQLFSAEPDPRKKE